MFATVGQAEVKTSKVNCRYSYKSLRMLFPGGSSRTGRVRSTQPGPFLEELFRAHQPDSSRSSLTRPRLLRRRCVDELSITLTHVCRGWRNIFISRSSLWADIEFKNIDKTRTYIQRSNSSPLNIYLGDDDDDTNLDAFSSAVPHLPRLKSLTIFAVDLPDTLKHFYFPAPLLEELDINVDSDDDQVLDGSLFDGDFSSLHQLRLCGVTTHLPWRNLVNLQVVKIESCRPVCKITQLLDFFESAPILHTIELEGSIPTSSDALPERIVSPTGHHYLKNSHSVVRSHLSLTTSHLLQISKTSLTSPWSTFTSVL